MGAQSWRELNAHCLDCHALEVWPWNLHAEPFHQLFVSLDPETEDTTLPVKESSEYRPFTRKLPEFKFWWSGARATAVALGMTFIPFFDLPVYWPILLAYFILLLAPRYAVAVVYGAEVLTMKDRVKHMIKHKRLRYVPFNFGKQTYGELSKVKADFLHIFEFDAKCPNHAGSR
eukprot:Skav207859  [mRNA]  locus=scaffold1988:65170:66353:+ [translate_table: standard]